VASSSTTPNSTRNQKISGQSPPPSRIRDRQRDAEDHRDLAHQSLRVGTVVQIADHRTADDHAHAGGHALQGTEDQQRGHVP